MASKPLVSIWNEGASPNRWFNIGIDIPCPSNYTGISTTLVDSGRNTDGQVIGDVIKSDVAKVELKWNYLTVEQYASLAQLFEQKYGGSFFVACCFFDIVKGGWDGDNTKEPTSSSGNNPCRKFYCGDRKVQVAHIKLDETTGAPIGYTGVSLNLIDTGLMYGEEL